MVDWRFITTQPVVCSMVWCQVAVSPICRLFTKSSSSPWLVWNRITTLPWKFTLLKKKFIHSHVKKLSTLLYSLYLLLQSNTTTAVWNIEMVNVLATTKLLLAYNLFVQYPSYMQMKYCNAWSGYLYLNLFYNFSFPLTLVSTP